MKGIILAGGTGSRLYPLTKVTNKHLLPVGNQPMIYHPIKKLVEAGIEDILIVSGTEHMGDMIELLGSGKNVGCKFTYRVQDEANGIAKALELVKDFVGNDNMIVLLGDNIFETDLLWMIENYKKYGNKGAMVVLKEVDDPHRFGVAEVHDLTKVISIEEKPANPKTNLAITGIYFYDSKVFDIIERLEISPRGEYEISDVNRIYMQMDELYCSRLGTWWTDAGTFESLQKANELSKGGK